MEFDPVFKAARVKHSKLTNEPISPTAYGDLLRPITWNEYKNYLANKRKIRPPENLEYDMHILRTHRNKYSAVCSNY